MTTVKITKFPGRTEEVMLEDGSTVQDAIDSSSVAESADGFTIKINGNEATSASSIIDGDRIILATSTKGA